MKSMFAGAAALALLAAPAALADDIGAGYLGNTVVVSYDDGREVSWFFESDGTFTNSDGLTGSYTVDGVTLCFSAETDAGTAEFCTESYNPDAAAGDSWTDTGDDGTTFGVRIDAGRN